MKILYELSLKVKKDRKTIFFGIPDTGEEMQEMFELRRSVYIKNEYINTESDKDEYDRNGKCAYFIAIVDKKIIGTSRFIIDEYLPTERECFKFDEPDEIKKIPRNKRVEFGRLIVVAPEEGAYLPRNLILLFLFKTSFETIFKEGFDGGYAFVTKKLYNKLRKLKFPLHLIKNYVQVYPENGIMWPYFNKKDNPIYPIFCLRKEIEAYLFEIFEKKNLFKKNGEGKFSLKETLYLKFLRLLKII